MGATKRGPGWMSGLPDDELADYKGLGIKQARAERAPLPDPAALCAGSGAAAAAGRR